MYRTDGSDGGPAFPQLSELGDIAYTQGGMSLRDWFAGQALAGLMANPNGPIRENKDLGFDYVSGSGESDVASEAYDLADAMLEARDK